MAIDITQLEQALARQHAILPFSGVILVREQGPDGTAAELWACQPIGLATKYNRYAVRRCLWRENICQCRDLPAC